MCSAPRVVIKTVVNQNGFSPVKLRLARPFPRAGLTNGTAHIFEDKSALDRLSGRRGGRIPKAFYDGRFPMAPRILRAADRAFGETLRGEARRPRPGARLSYPGKKDKKISYMLSRQRYAEWLPTAINTTGCTTFSRKRGTGAGHGPRGHG
jgi:hypothetical protein